MILFQSSRLFVFKRTISLSIKKVVTSFTTCVNCALFTVLPRRLIKETYPSFFVMNAMNKLSFEYFSKARSRAGMATIGKRRLIVSVWVGQMRFILNVFPRNYESDLLLFTLTDRSSASSSVSLFIFYYLLDCGSIFSDGPSQIY